GICARKCRTVRSGGTTSVRSALMPTLTKSRASMGLLKSATSSRRTPGGGFTLEVQHLSKGLGGSSEVKAFTGRIVVGGDELTEAAGWEGCEVGFAGDEAAHSTDGIFDAALLPGGVGIAEEGLDREVMQREVAGELGCFVE